MNHTELLIILVIAVAIVVGVAFLLIRKRRSQQLRERFGPEYDRVLKHEGDVRKAEDVLEFREKRRAKFKLRALSPQDRSSFESKWDEVQNQFVDDPKEAVTQSDRLVARVMHTRGYPMGEFNQRAADFPLIIQ
jgi:FtsZ-interacting cell division protein ZipA